MFADANDKDFNLLMALLISVVAISIDALLPALGLIGAELGVTDINRTQLVIGCIFAGMAVGQLVAGPLSDALGRKPVLYAGLALYLAGSLFCWLVRDFELLLVGRVIQGLGVSAPYVTAMSVVRDKYAGRDMARIMSLIMVIFMLVPAIAPSLGLAILHLADWRTIFLVYVVYAVAIGGWIALRLEETLPPGRRSPLTARAFGHGFRTVEWTCKDQRREHVAGGAVARPVCPRKWQRHGRPRYGHGVGDHRIWGDLPVHRNYGWFP